MRKRHRKKNGKYKHTDAVSILIRELTEYFSVMNERRDEEFNRAIGIIRGIGTLNHVAEQRQR